MESPLADFDLDDPVARHMRREFILLPGGLTVGEALEFVHERQPEGRIIYFYVADAEGRLAGVVPTRNLLLGARGAPLSEVMLAPAVAIGRDATVLDACRLFAEHKLLAFPVVDDDRRVVGVIDVDLYTRGVGDLERRAGGDDLFRLIGVYLTEAQRRSPLRSFRRRFPWLLANIAGGLLAALISNLYADVATLAVVVPFIPVVLALAESVTIQSVSLTIQTLRGARPTLASLFPRAGRELGTGALLGAACGLIVGAVAVAWMGRASVALSLLGGIAGSVACAAVLGLTVPYLVHLSRQDPRIAAGPVALATTDMVTLLVYFNLARWLLAG